MISPKISYVSIKNLSEDDRPREKLIENGRASLSNAEIMAILIGSGTTEKSAVELSREILNFINNDLDKLARLSVADLTKFKGIGKAKAVTIVAAIELGKRKEHASIVKETFIKSSKDIYHHVKERFQGLDHEEFYIILVNRAHKVKAVERVSVGGISGTAVDGKIIFKKALEHSASGVILCHNHPSGNLVPSKEDIELTRELVNFGKYIQLPVVDHLIVTDSYYFSFVDEGIIK